MAGLVPRVYRTMLRTLADMDRAALPLVGVAGLSQRPSLNFPAELHQRFRREPPVDDMFLGLRRLKAQQQVLASGDEGTRKALASWHRLLLDHRAAAHVASLMPDHADTWLPAAVSARDPAHVTTGPGHELVRLQVALEAGALLVDQIYQENHRSLDDVVADLEDGFEAREAENSQQGCSEQLDLLAQGVAERHNKAFINGSGSTSPQEALRAQLEAISQELFGRLKFKHAPVEWLYDGLDPLMLPAVLHSRRGVPLSLAVLYCSVARRLGVTVVPVRASGGSSSVAQGPAGLSDLPPEVRARQASRAPTIAPTPDSWLVQAVAPGSATFATAGGGSSGEVLYVDVDRKGVLYSQEQAVAKYPEVSASSELPCVVELWAGLCRAAMVAHTRRGESELVAHWLVQVLALDPGAPEWEVMMQPQQQF